MRSWFKQKYKPNKIQTLQNTLILITPRQLESPKIVSTTLDRKRIYANLSSYPINPNTNPSPNPNPPPKAQ